MAFIGKEIIIGEVAKNQLKKNPKNAIINVEKLTRRKYEKENIENGLFKIIKDPETNESTIQITFENEKKKYYPENIIAMILQNLKKKASDFLGKEVKNAVISIPNYYNLLEREKIIDAAKDSGLNIFHILKSSTAAGIAYCYEKNIKSERLILIFDLGGGTLNLSLISFGNEFVEVQSVNGDLNLGGEDFTLRLFEYCSGEFRRKTGIDIRKNSKAKIRLYNACENAKKTLSSATNAEIDLEYLMDGEDFNIIITKDKFEELCMDLFKKCIPPLEKILKDSRVYKSQIDDIVLVGGSSRIPKIQQIIKEFFNGKELNKGLNPEESIAYGLAIEAAIKDNVNNEKIERFVLLDVNPFSLGIETVGGVMTILIPRNSSIPKKKTTIFSTYEDNQSFVSVEIYEGEGKLTKDNLLLGILSLSDLPPMPRGVPIIEITFRIDFNFKLNITVKEISTGKTSKMIFSKETRKIHPKRHGPLIIRN